MTWPTQGNGRPDGRPLCWNREPVGNTVVVNDRMSEDGRQLTVEIPNRFSRDCKSWVADPSTDPVPLAEGWRCDGCQRFPHESYRLAITRRDERASGSLPR